MWLDGASIEQAFDVLSKVALGVGTLVTAIVTAYLMVRSKLEERSKKTRDIQKVNSGVEIVQGQTIDPGETNLLKYLMGDSEELNELRTQYQDLQKDYRTQGERLNKALLRLAENSIRYQDI